MTDIWYTTSSTDGGYNLDTPKTTFTPPNTNFVPYDIPVVWSNILSNSEDILIDSNTINSNNQVFMSKNPEVLVKLIYTWNCYTESTGDYIDWD
mgnify:CR=1 FL=1